MPLSFFQSMTQLLGPCLRGRTQCDGPQSAVPVVFHEHLRLSAQICGCLRFPAPSRCSNFQEKRWICENLLSKQGSTPTPWAWGLRDQIQKWALQTQKTLYSWGFLCSEGYWDHGLRPWSRKGPDHGVGADPETVICGFCKNLRFGVDLSP